MSNISLKSIKYESIKAIFASISSADKISRAEIAQQTGLSLVTVGKIADALLEADIACETKEIRAQAGRRAGVLSVNYKKYALIFDLTSYNFKYSVLDLRMHQLHTHEFVYKSGLSYNENINIFFGEAFAFVDRNFEISNSIGIGIAVPGVYCKSDDNVPDCKIAELSSIKLVSAVSQYFGDVPLIIDSHTNAAAKFNIEQTECYKDKNILYWYLSSDYISGAYSVGGELVSGHNSRFCDFGSLLVHKDLTFEDKISLTKSREDCAEVVVPAMYNIIKILYPHTIIIEFDTKYSTDGIIPIIKEQLEKKYRLKKDDMPELSEAFAKCRSSQRGLAMSLRELWLDKIVFS